MGITKKQKDARIKNYSKGRLKGMVVSLRQIKTINNISKDVRDFLSDASILVQNALNEWDIRKGA